MKKIISALLAVTMLFTVALPITAAEIPAVQFSDVPQDSFAYSDILQLRKLGVSNGMGDGTYGLYSTFKRCDFVLMLARLMAWDTTQKAAIYDDVAADHYAAGAINAAAKLSVLPAGEKLFRPNDFITRAEMAKCLRLRLAMAK